MTERGDRVKRKLLAMAESWLRKPKKTIYPLAGSIRRLPGSGAGARSRAVHDRAAPCRGRPGLRPRDPAAPARFRAA